MRVFNFFKKKLDFFRGDYHQYYEYVRKQNKFCEALNKTAKKHGYERMLFAENDNHERLVGFRRIEEKHN